MANSLVPHYFPSGLIRGVAHNKCSFHVVVPRRFCRDSLCSCDQQYLYFSLIVFTVGSHSDCKFLITLVTGVVLRKWERCF